VTVGIKYFAPVPSFCGSPTRRMDLHQQKPEILILTLWDKSVMN